VVFCQHSINSDPKQVSPSLNLYTSLCQEDHWLLSIPKKKKKSLWKSINYIKTSHLLTEPQKLEFSSLTLNTVTTDSGLAFLSPDDGDIIQFGGGCGKPNPE
jgi:hypothetical protein